MRPRVGLSILLLVVSCSLFAHAPKTRPRVPDPTYSLALAAANRFLHAWQTEDHETGIMMLTDSARQHASADRLEDFFSPGPLAAYEIARGKRLAPGAYSFPVVLFGVSTASSQPRHSTLIVTRMGKNDWAVDRLP